VLDPLQEPADQAAEDVRLHVERRKQMACRLPLELSSRESAMDVVQSAPLDVADGASIAVLPRACCDRGDL
jgi:hypothetical protein